eukprot:143325-Pleurochrysis_carterae.AAC.2
MCTHEVVIGFAYVHARVLAIRAWVPVHAFSDDDAQACGSRGEGRFQPPARACIRVLPPSREPPHLRRAASLPYAFAVFRA